MHSGIEGSSGTWKFLSLFGGKGSFHVDVPFEDLPSPFQIHLKIDRLRERSKKKVQLRKEHIKCERRVGSKGNRESKKKIWNRQPGLDIGNNTRKGKIRDRKTGMDYRE